MNEDITDEERRYAFRNMMNVMSKIEKAARAQFPGVSKERLQEICSGAMNHALGIKKK